MQSRLILLVTLVFLVVTLANISCLQAQAEIDPASQSLDLALLTQPSTATYLKLTDEQRVKLVQLMQRRVEALATDDDATRQQTLREIQAEVAKLLTVEQVEAYHSLPGKAKLTFNFRQQQWIDVLDWFARQAGLSLVVNEPPTGTFTYSDTKAYTPIEALDLLNGVLTTRGFTLIRRERMLVCADISQGVPSGLIPRVRLEDLDQYGNFEFIQVMFPLGAKSAQAVSDEIEPLLGQFGKATVLSQTKQILVVTTAGKMRAVNAVIASIPEPSAPAPSAPAPKPELVIYPVQSLDPKVAVDTLSALFSGAQLTFDQRAGQINAFALPNEHAAIKKMLDQMAEQASGEYRPQLETYAVNHPDPEQLVDQIQLVVPQATVSVGTDPTRLIVFAEKVEHQRIAETLTKLDAAADELSDRVAVVYELKQVDASSITEAVKSLFPRIDVVADADTRRFIVVGSLTQQSAIKQLLERIDASAQQQRQLRTYDLDRSVAGQIDSVLKPLVPDAQITQDADANRLIVVASETDHGTVDRILKQLSDHSEPPVPKRLQIYRLTDAQRQQFMTTFRSLAPDLEQITVNEDQAAGALRIVATEDEHQQLGQIVTDIKQQLPQEVRQLRAYTMSESLDKSFRSLRNQLAPELARVQITDRADAPGVIVVATEEEHATIAKLLKDLQDALPDETAQIRVLAVSPAQRKRFLALLPSLQKELGSLRIVDESQPSELTIWATDRQTARVARILQTLKVVQPGPAKQLVAYPLKNAQPEGVLTILQELHPDTRIVIDNPGRRVLVWTDADEHEQIEQAIEQLDAPSAAGIRKMAYYKLGEIRVDEILELFQQLLPEMSLVVDQDTNSIIAWGTSQDHQTLSKTVQEIRTQGGSDDPRTVVSYPCGARDVEDVRRLIGELVPDARLVADPENRALVAWASSEDHQTIRDAIARMTRAEDGADGQLRVYWLSRIEATDLLPILKTTVPSAQLTASADQRQVLVWATTADHEKIDAAVRQIEAGQGMRQDGTVRVYRSHPDVIQKVRELVSEIDLNIKLLSGGPRGQLSVWASESEHKRLDQLIRDLEEQVEKTPLQLASYSLEDLTAAEARQFISSVIPDVQFLDSNDASRLLVRAPAEDHLLIEETLKQLREVKGERQPQQVRVYPLGDHDPDRITSLLDSSLTDGLSVIKDSNRNTLIVRATTDRHQALKDAIDELVSELPDMPKMTSRVYRFKNADAESLEESLDDLIPQARFAIDDATGSLIATALPDDHQRIEQVVTQLDAPVDSDRQTKVYRFRYADVTAAQTALQALLPDAIIATDATSRALVATASDDDHRQIEATVQQLDVAREDPTVTRVYPFQFVDVTAAQQVLTSLLPNASIAVDTEHRILVATASAEEHSKIEATVRQMDAKNDRQPTLQAFAVANADAASISETLRTMYQGNSLVTISLDPLNNAILAKAPAEDHATIAQIVARMDNARPAADERSLQVYTIQGTVDESLQDTLQTLFDGQREPADLSFNEDARQLVAVATSQQHELIKSAIDQMRQDEVVVEVFSLQAADPFAVQTAIDQLYQDEVRPPVANGDIETQQLFVRGTKDQLEDIRQLLIKMGEMPSDAQTQKGLRVIPFRGDVEQAIRQLQEVWPKLRENKLEVIRLQDRTRVQPIDPLVEPPSELTEPPAAQPPKNEQPAPQDDVQVTPPAEQDAQSDTSVVDTHLIAAVDPDAKNDDDVAQPSTNKLPSSIIMIPGSGAITIMSQDEEALNQVQALLATLARQSIADNSAGNFAVYLLRNAGAQKVAKLLDDLFQQMPITTRITLGKVSIVADQRLNALVVHGRPADRRVIAELLKVLDSTSVPESLANARPQIVQLEYADAERIQEILSGIYETQLSGGGNRPEISIPEGISSDVASVLEQINAQASGPLLTLEVDDVTNSIVILAPRLLAEEVETLIQQLDRQARQHDSRDIGIISLKSTNVSQIEEALEKILAGE